MTAGDQYRVKAAELHAKAQYETNPTVRAELDNLALAYLRLADQAERNAETDISYSPILPKPGTEPEAD